MSADKAINERVIEWFNYQKEIGKSKASIAADWGKRPQYISSLGNGKGSIGLAVIKQILYYDQSLNARWLLLGHGEMYEDDLIFQEPDEKYNNGITLFKQTNNLIKELNSELKLLREQLNIKDSQIEFLQNVIENQE